MREWTWAWWCCKTSRQESLSQKAGKAVQNCLCVCVFFFFFSSHSIKKKKKKKKKKKSEITSWNSAVHQGSSQQHVCMYVCGHCACHQRETFEVLFCIKFKTFFYSSDFLSLEMQSCD